MDQITTMDQADGDDEDRNLSERTLSARTIPALPDTSAEDAQALALLDRARTTSITSQASYREAGEALKTVKTLRKAIEERYSTLKDFARRLVDAVRRMIESHLSPLDEAERVLKQKMIAFDVKCERERQERERKAQEAAQRKAEEERRANVERMKRESAERSRQLAAAGLTEETRDQILADAEAVAATESAPVLAPLVTVASRCPKVDGIATREQWSAEVTDLPALVRYVAENPQFVGLLVPNQTALNQMARSLKGAMAIPGVAARSQRVMAASKRAG